MTTTTKKLGAGITISAEQAIPVILLVLCAFLKTFALVMFDTGASVFFLETYLGDYIPQVFIGIALLLFILSFGMFKAKEVSQRMPVFLMIGAGIISLILYTLLRMTSLSYTPVVLMSWKEGFRLTIEASFWITAFRFGVFQKKHKTLGVLVLTQGIAALLSGLFIRVLVDTNAYDTLIPWACLFIFTCAFLMDLFINNGSAPISEHFIFSKQATKRSGKERLQKRLYFLFFLVSGLLAFSAGLINYTFLKNTALIFGEQPEAISLLYAVIYATLGALILLALVLSFKMRIALLTISIFLAVPLCLFLAGGAGYAGIFSLIVTAKIVHDLVFMQTKEPVMQIIPRAISPRLDFRTNVLRKTIVEPSGILFAGLFLLYYEKVFDTGITPVLILAGIILLIAVILLYQTYIKIVLASLQNHLWRGGRLMIFGKALWNWIDNALQNPAPDEAIYALRVLEDAQHPRCPCDLEKALRHPSEYVRLFALERLEAQDFSSTIEEVEACAETDESLAVRRLALRVMCRIGTVEQREKAILLINDPDLREGALIGLLAAGAEGVFVAIDTLNLLSTSSDPEDRILVAKVLGEARNPAFYRPLLVLFQDDETSVCNEALLAAGKLLTPRLLPAIMNSFRNPELRETGVATLLQYREIAFPAIAEVMKSTDNPIQFRSLLAKTLGRIHSPTSEAFLFDHLTIDDRRVRFNILKSLVLMGYKVQGKKITKVRLSLYDEIEWATGLLAALEDFKDHDEERLGISLKNLRVALLGEIEYAKERIMLLLALLHPTPEILNLLNHFAMTTEEERDGMARIVDKILSGELRTLCLPLFQKISTAEQLAMLRPHFLPPILSFKDRMQDLLKIQPGESTDWTRASIAYVAGYVGESTVVDALITLLTDHDAIVRETAVWALGRILPPEEASRLMHDTLNDPVPAVSRMARFVVDGAGRVFF